MNNFLDDIKVDFDKHDKTKFLNYITDLLDNEFKLLKISNCIQPDILDTFVDINIKQIFSYVQKRQMMIGKNWQKIIGYYDDFKDLGKGHYSGCDLFSRNRKIIIELKNRYNTDNYSSRKTNYDKLSKFKNTNKDFMCVYGVINSKGSFNNGKIKKIIHNKETIYYYSGCKFFELVFGKNYQFIIEHIKKNMKNNEIIVKKILNKIYYQLDND